MHTYSRRLANLLSFGAFLGMCLHVNGQNPGNATASGYPENAVIHGTEIESVQVTNGNLHVEIPIWSAKGRGIDTAGSYVYDNKQWFLSEQCYTSGICVDTTTAEAGSNMVLTAHSSLDYVLSYKGSSCVNGVTIPLMTNVVIREPNGTKHHFAPDPVVMQGTATCNGAPITSTLYADDGSGWVATLDSNGLPLYATRKDGNKGGFEDSNGNQIAPGSPGVDTLGRAIYGGGTYVDTGGTQRSATVTSTTQVTVSTGMCAYSVADQCSEHTATWTVPAVLTLPNGMTFSFGYEQNAGAEINSITLPTGGQVTYTYGGWFPGGRAVTSRKVSANSVTGTWTYNGITVTDPYGNDTVGDCGPNANGSYPFIQPCYPKTRKYYSGSQTTGTLLKTEITDYTAYTLGTLTNNVQVPTRVTTTWNLTNQATKTETDWDTKSVTGGTAVWENPMEKREYGFGTGVAGSLVRRTDYDYLHRHNSSYLNVNIADRPTSKIVYDGSGNIVAQTTYTYDGTAVTGTTGAPGHDYTNFSSTNNIRGNVTQVSRWLNQTGTWLNTLNTNNDLGDLLTTKDPKLNVTSFDYTDNFTDGTNRSTLAFVTKTTYPTTNGVSHIERKQFYYNLGPVAASCGQNFPSATSCTYNAALPQSDYTNFVYDLMNRPTTITRGDQGQSTFSYNDATYPLSLSSSRSITSPTTNLFSKTTILDDMGRIKQSQLTSDPSGTTYVDTTYDAFGRVATVSNPYRTTTETTYGLTTYKYDPLGRTCVVIPPDGTSVSGTTCPTTRPAKDRFIVYSGNATTTTNEVGNSRQSVVDALGRLTTVFEDPSVSHFETDYGYDVLDNLVSVTQNGTDSTKARKRSFTFDSLSRIVCAANPEVQPVTCPSFATGTFPTGAITYAYDANGNLITKISPSPNQPSTGTAKVTISYNNYDALNRLGGKGYSDTYASNPATASVSYGYDGIALTGCNTPPPTLTDNNPKGRRTAMCDGSGATSWSHDLMGRMGTESRKINGVGQTTSYTYNYDDSLATLVYPSTGKTLTYTTLRDGRQSAVKDVAGSINYVQNATYAASGGLTGMSNGASITVTNAYNARLQPILLSAKTASSILFSLCYDFHLGILINNPTPCSFSASTAGDNGNVYQVWNNRDNSRNEIIAYDALNRIASAHSNGTQWGENFVIDAWGNLIQETGISGYINSEGLNVSVGSNNQFTTTSGFTYDAAGNMATNGSTTYKYDGENRLTTTGGYTYYYDGDGNRAVKTNGSTGTLYWRGPTGDPISESSLTGASQEEYVFFNGARVARRDVSSGLQHYYFSDYVGSHGVVVNSTGTTFEQDIDYYPFGAVAHDYSPNLTQHYRFDGKERDTESGLDNFGARYDASNLARFMTPDWAAKPTTVPYASFGNPQSLNLFSFVNNNPTTTRDPDGHETQDTLDPQQTREAGNTIAGAVIGLARLAVGTWNGAANLLNSQTGYGLQTLPMPQYENKDQAITGAVAQLATVVYSAVEGATASSTAKGAEAATTATSSSEAANSATAASKVDSIVNTIDSGGFKVAANAKTATQEANVTITHPSESGVKLNLRTETHPLEPGGQPVRHVNVERVEPGPKNRPEVKSNTHIDQ